MTNKTHTFIIETWINCKANVVRIYKGSDAKFYYKAIGVPLTEIEESFVNDLIWLENNRNGVKAPLPSIEYPLQKVA